MGGIRVWYEPPPYGPRTSLDRPAYSMTRIFGPRWLNKLSKLPEHRVIPVAVLGLSILAAIPIFCRDMKLPHTLSPEYQAAQLAYMRYHNMNPIFGPSSKESREKDGRICCSVTITNMIMIIYDNTSVNLLKANNNYL